MSERRPYTVPARRKEWISLAGGDLCLWSFTMAEHTAIEEYAMRPPEDPRGGYDLSEAALWQIALAAYTGEEETARRRWGDLQVHEIRGIPARDFQRLVVAIGRLNEMDAGSEAAARDFTPAEPAGSTLPSRSGVSATSTGSP